MPDDQEQPEETTGTVVQLRATETPTETALEQAPAPAYLDTTGRPGERLPIWPVAWRRRNVRSTVAITGGETWYRTRFHGIRFPLYLVAVLVWAVIGLVRLVARQLAWWWVSEQEGLRSQAAADGDAREWAKLHKDAKADRHFRGIVLAGEVLALVLALGLLLRFGPWWSWAAAAAVVLPLLARIGQPDGHRIVGTAIVPPDYSPPTHPIISDALGSLNISQINAALKPDKEGHAEGIRFITDVMQSGPGWSCHLDLPRGVSVSAILAKREDLASGLRRPLTAVWPEGLPEVHPGRMDLWVGFQDISKAKPPVCPLVKAKQTDLFDSIPFGTSPRGRGVGVGMFELNWLIGAAPGQGKTATLRVLASGAALDPLADIWINELSGKGDLEPFAKVSHRYTSGLDDESIAYAATSARLLKAETDKRAAMFRKLKGSGLMPDAKVTRELAARYRELRPLVAIFDEVQNLLMDKTHGAQAAEDLAYVIRVGRAYGIIATLATQRPDAKIIPTSITGLILGRFCLMVPDWLANDLVLGTSAYKRGYDATVFRPKLDAGLGWLKGGEDGMPQICRTYYLDLPATERIAARARDMRDRAGVLTGYALGESVQAEKRDVLADVLACFGGAPALHWDELSNALADRWPDRWGDITEDAIKAQCRGLGVQSVMVSRSNVKDYGCRRAAVEKMAASGQQ